MELDNKKLQTIADNYPVMQKYCSDLIDNPEDLMVCSLITAKLGEVFEAAEMSPLHRLMCGLLIAGASSVGILGLDEETALKA